MTSTEDTESTEEARVEGQKLRLKVKEKARCSMVTMLPRSLHCEPRKARLSGRDDKQQ
jgi:hypothetical protein